jgi:membrane protease YdiL (CAAX protease family)
MSAGTDVQTPADRGDRLPAWVIALLAAWLALRLVSLFPALVPAHGARLSQQLAGSVDEKTMAALMGANLTAKQAYVASLARPGSAPDPKALRDALRAAETLQKDGGNTPGAARRVLILRALLGRPLFGPGKNGLDPRQAYAPAALADLPPADARRYAQEGRVWAEVARGPHLSPSQTAACAAQLRAVPNIRWWLSPALSVLYGSQGNPALAAHYAARARAGALATVAPLGLMSLLWGVLGLGGAVFLLYMLLRRLTLGSPAPLPSPWPAVRETVPREERRLRAGDLLGVFVLYLLMPDLIGWLAGGFRVPHLLAFPGLLQPLRGRIAALPGGQHAAALVVLELVAYLIAAAIPIGLLLGIARRKGASVGDELGWNRHRLGRNLLYGVAGYGVALPLVLVAGAAGPQIFRHAPAPSNPAIPLLAGASSVWAQALLVGLATVAAPLTEEFLFRGVFLQAAKLRLGAWPAIVLTGLVFGFVHPVGLAGMLPLAVLGGVFAWMAETRQSLAPSILAHFLQNSFATLMLLLALGG